MCACRIDALLCTEAGLVVVNNLREMGLTDCEIRLYFYLITAEPQGIKELAEKTGFHKTTIKQFLANLQKNDLVERLNKSSRRYKALELSTLLNLLLLRISLQIQELENFKKKLLKFSIYFSER